MDATLAPPRNQLDPLENHWNSLHFQCPALMRNSARQRHPGGQSENLTVIGKSSKTIGYSDILRSRAAWSRIKYLGEIFSLVRLWFELRTMHTETLQNHWKTYIFAFSGPWRSNCKIKKTPSSNLKSIENHWRFMGNHWMQLRTIGKQRKRLQENLTRIIW